jgi:guanylate kinase
LSAKETLVLIGPGGVGKGTVARELVRRAPSLWLSRSWTTRPPRPGENDEYVFTDEATFRDAIARDAFLEWAPFHGYLYGTPLPTPNPGQRVLLEIEVQGAAQVLAHEPDAIVVLLVPPSVEALRDRLVGRGDDEAHVADRLASTEEELAVGRGLTKHVVVNHDVASVAEEILSILNGPHRAGETS